MMVVVGFVIKMMVICEFDTFVHKECLKRELNQEFSDREAIIMGKELDVTYDIQL